MTRPDRVRCIGPVAGARDQASGLGTVDGVTTSEVLLPEAGLDAAAQVDDLAAMVARGRCVVLSGAGLSTDSGIPDYRGPGSIPRSPMTYQEFCSGSRARQRYWARSHLGWQRLDRALPNEGHHAVAALERVGLVAHTITQNVDGLHADAGARRVTDLHGRIDQVICLTCNQVSPRSELHARLVDLNPGFGASLSVPTAPDGDVDLEDTSGFRVASCTHCGGVLKPRVVFFGENVPKSTVSFCYATVAGASSLLVLGSSLSVQSGLRFVRRAHSDGIPVAIVNRGATRGDALASLRFDAGCSQTLTALLAALAL
jgi:NAD-dependent SIR2 family protein deacetylase